ncbi:MAG: SWIM zinc finger family protein [Saprospiraceae bacterium]|nr:SWIM zinc finger family protein [Saprospiraceae bacterium]
MQFDYKFFGNTAVSGSASAVDMAFAPDVSRPPTFFRGVLSKSIAFREAISALHEVVVSDLRFKPKDKTAYKEWAAQQEVALLAEFGAGYQAGLQQQIQAIRTELQEIGKNRNTIMGPYYTARQKYFNYLYEKEKELWFALDPVITVHPDEIFFECFSQDEATYGRLGSSYEVFKHIGEFACGTTNIDYSASLYQEFQKIREYKDTNFVVDPSGFQVQTTNEDLYHEVKIDLPDSWVRGFLQVSSAMTLPATSFELHPMDVHNICQILRRKKEKMGPRSLRFILQPGRPVELLFEPWNIRIACRRSVYTGRSAEEIRLWGRRRLLILERLIPVMQKLTVHLLGNGMPSFFIADLGHQSFTLGLSGWTANDWSRAGNFDLMAPRMEVDFGTKEMIFKSLRENWTESSAHLAQRLNLDLRTVEGALSAYTQAGLVMYDLNKKTYRLRELSRDPLPLDALRLQNPRETEARAWVEANQVSVQAQAQADGHLKLSGTVKEKNSNHKAWLLLDRDERLTEAACDCWFHQQNQLRQGPCTHLLALRIAHNRQNWWSRWLLN